MIIKDVEHKILFTLITIGLLLLAGMPPHMRYKHPPRDRSPGLGGLPMPINPNPASSSGSIMMGTPIKRPPGITTGIPNPELRESGKTRADSSSGMFVILLWAIQSEMFTPTVKR